MESNLVIGCIHGYTYEQIEPWVVSLKKSGFTGKVALIVFEGSALLLKKLFENGIYVIMYNKDSAGNAILPVGMTDKGMLMSFRFYVMWRELCNNAYFADVKNVLTTDVKDVIFQDTPDALFSPYHEIIISHEGFTYDVEPWSGTNMKACYGDEVFQQMRYQPIICAGVIAGKIATVKSLFNEIWLLTRASRYTSYVPGGGGPDQAALNIILSAKPWQLSASSDSRILHAGTSIPGIIAGNGDIGMAYRKDPSVLEHYRKSFQIPSEPFIMDDGVIINTYQTLGSVTNGQVKPYKIVHQYDRLPAWKETIYKKYKE